MGNIRIPIPYLYWQAFGLPRYAPNNEVFDVEGASAFDSAKILVPDADVQSFFGTPIHLPCKIQNTKRGDALDYFTLPNEPLIEINGGKRMIETVIDGNDGTFKELFSLNDYNVVIRGIAVNDDDPESYPEDIVRMLRKIYELRNSVAIVNKLTTMFGIKLISIIDLRLPAIEGSYGYQPYEFICKSDKEFDLELKKKNG